MICLYYLVMKILGSKKLLDVTGKPIVENESIVTVGSVLANILSMSQGENSGDTVRLYKIAMDLYNKSEYEVNSETIDFIIKYVEKATLVAIVKGQLITILEESKK